MSRLDTIAHYAKLIETSVDPRKLIPELDKHRLFAQSDKIKRDYGMKDLHFDSKWKSSAKSKSKEWYRDIEARKKDLLQLLIETDGKLSQRRYATAMGIEPTIVNKWMRLLEEDGYVLRKRLASGIVYVPLKEME